MKEHKQVKAYKKYLNKVNSNIKRLEKVTNDLKSFSLSLKLPF